MPATPMVRVTTVGDPIEAKIIAARLGSEGVLWELRGGVDGPYPMGPFHVYVAADDVALAHDVLALAGETGAAEPSEEAGGRSGRAPLALWLVVLSVVALAAFAV